MCRRRVGLDFAQWWVGVSFFPASSLHWGGFSLHRSLVLDHFAHALGNAIILADFFFSLPSYSLVVLRGFFFSLSLSLVCLGRTFFFFISLVQQYTSLPTSLTPNHINFVHVHFTLFCYFSFCVSLGFFFSSLSKISFSWRSSTVQSLFPLSLRFLWPLLIA